jgi:ferrous iron transport protein A
MTAADLKFGQKAKIDSLDKSHPSSFRLLEYGFTPGQEIELINIPIFKDPIQISIRGTLIALRKSDAKCIKIKLN